MLVEKMVRSKMMIFTLFASLASILSLFGWAAEKFLEFAPSSIGLFSFYVIGLFFLWSLVLLVLSAISYERVKGLKSDYQLSHRISHHLRNAITELQDLEFSVIRRIDGTDSEKQFVDIKENDELKRKMIFKKLGAKTTGSVVKQLENYFMCNGLIGNIRVTIKSILPDSDNQLEWGVRTAVVDPFTWNNQDRVMEEKEDEVHKIGENTDFEGILLGNEKYFVNNDLSGLSDDAYKNSSKNWRRRYNSTMVVPIKNKPDGKINTVYYGFVTADSLNPKKQNLFESSQEAATLNILAHAADALAVWFVKNDNHTKNIESSFAERIGIIEMAKAIDEMNRVKQELKEEQ